MKRYCEPRISAIRSGRLLMSSRWISISLSGALLTWRARAALTPACAAFTSDDLPMPRAPHSNALLAGRPLAKRSVFSTSTSRTRSMPLSSDISTRLTRLTGASRRPSGCHTKASAAAKSVSGARCGASRSSAPAMRARTSALPPDWAVEAGLAFPSAFDFCGDLDFDLAIKLAFRNCAALSALSIAPASGPARKRPKMAGFEGSCGVAIGATAAIVRAKLGFDAGPGTLAWRAPQNHARDASMFISTAFAQGSLFGGAGGDSGNMMMSLLPFALIFVIMYFLILRPQQKRVKQHAELVKNVRRGDTVITNGGLVGKVTKVIDDDQIEIEIADDVRIRQVRSMITDVRAKGEPVKDEAAAG